MKLHADKPDANTITAYGDGWIADDRGHLHALGEAGNIEVGPGQLGVDLGLLGEDAGGGVGVGRGVLPVQRPEQVVLPHRRERDAAVADRDRRDAVPARRAEVVDDAIAITIVRRELARNFEKKRPELTGLFSSFQINAPQLQLDVNRDKAKSHQLALGDVVADRRDVVRQVEMHAGDGVAHHPLQRPFRLPARRELELADASLPGGAGGEQMV